ncbi:MAG: hybrid sensor histidine kinase/response regulator [Verrucomicrobiaceae bacterium]|nr:MAG: hybrid sensor histidine kinase/response regulator [Verrucomicrobiaceae bacterium]
MDFRSVHTRFRLHLLLHSGLKAKPAISSQMEPFSPPRKILVLDDNRIDRETCRRFLSRTAPAGSYFFVEHDCLDGALDLVHSERPDCILLDYHLHDGTGVEFLRGLHANGSTLEFPVVMLTGTGSESIAVEVMKIGAQDYLVKDRLTPEILQRTVEGAIYKASTGRLLEAQRREMERLFREAQEANARKDHFLATLSHELRTPLTPVLAAVAMLDDAAMTNPDELREIAAIIRRNVELEARLIDDMLDLTRISKGRLEVDQRPVNIQDVIHSALEICRDDIARHKIRIVQDFQAGNSLVSGDEARLQQVFWNLLQNAAKFTPDHGTITISTHDAGDGWLEVRVKDTGIGIPPSELENIFLSFDQGSTPAAKRHGGLGLGLAICRGLMEAHSGRIWAESDPAGIGAAFIVRLKSAMPSGTSVPAPDSPPVADRLPASGARLVMVVEDHEDSSFFFSRIIRRMGHQVLHARSTAEAVEIFRSHQVDCVISDIGLPDGTGTDLLPKLHAIRRVPAIALSGYGMEEDVRRSLDAGFSSHLIKPITSVKLTTALEEILRPLPSPD